MAEAVSRRYGAEDITEIYTIREAVPSDRDALLQLLMKYYMTGEPSICSHAQEGGLFRTGGYNLKQVIPFLSKVVDDNTVLVATDEKEEHVGMVILATDGKDNFKPLNSVNHGIGLFETLYFTEDLRQRQFYNVVPNLQNPVRLSFLTVARAHRRRGLATNLIQAGVHWACNKRDADMVYGLFTSMWARKAASSSGFSSIYDADLNTARDAEDGLRLFYDVKDKVLSIMTLDLTLDR